MYFYSRPHKLPLFTFYYWSIKKHFQFYNYSLSTHAFLSHMMQISSIIINIIAKIKAGTSILVLRLSKSSSIILNTFLINIPINNYYIVSHKCNKILHQITSKWLFILLLSLCSYIDNIRRGGTCECYELKKNIYMKLSYSLNFRNNLPYALKQKWNIFQVILLNISSLSFKQWNCLYLVYFFVHTNTKMFCRMGKMIKSQLNHYNHCCVPCKNVLFLLLSGKLVNKLLSCLNSLCFT